MCEPLDMYRETRPRARKRYQCEECSIPIEIGEQYVYGSGLAEWGEWWTFRLCIACREAATEFTNASGADCFTVGDLATEITYEFRGQEMPPACAGLLERLGETTEARRR